MKSKSTQSIIFPFIFLFLIVFTRAVFSQDFELWGLTQLGGEHKSGTIFKTNIEGENHEVVHPFYSVNCGNPWESLCEANNGKLYGLASSSYNNTNGAIFEYDPVLDTITIKCWFDGASTGYEPVGDLCLASNGLLYGMTSRGGLYDKGILFSYNPESDDFVKILDFSGEENGGYPTGSLIESDEEVLIGMTAIGGIYNNGVIFSINIITNSFSKHFDFETSSTGGNPNGKLLKYENNIYYGLAASGGQGSFGTLFRFDFSLELIEVKHHFYGSDGRTPKASLIKATNGKLYGTTE